MSVLLKNLSESSLISLSVRTTESKQGNRLCDAESSMVAEKLAINPDSYDVFFAHENIVASASIIERNVVSFINQNPESTVINLGCGYDNLFPKVDNKKLFWYDVDLPSVMEKRRNIFSSGERLMELEGNVLDHDWTVFVSKESAPLVIAEGLLWLFSAEQVSRLLEILTDSFPCGHLICDIWSPWAVKKLQKKYRFAEGRFGKGFASCQEISDLNPKIKLLKEFPLSVEFQKYGWASRHFCNGTDKKDSRVALFQW